MFQSTLPRGERLNQSVHLITSICVSIHAPARGATWCFDDNSMHSIWFQSTLPRGERPSWVLPFSLAIGFNPRSRAGSDNMATINTPLPSKFQSTLPRGERLWANFGLYCIFGVSIHAPARGATIGAKIIWTLWNVSIHAPARGATKIS